MKVFVLGKGLAAVLLIVAAVVLFISVKITCIPASSKTTRQLPIYNVNRSDMAVSVTFDCAWNDEDIDDIIKVLSDNGCISTFFVVGNWAQRYPEAVKKLANAGHEIANHSMSHAKYTGLSKEKMKDDMNKCDDVIKELTGKSSNLFRPPYGEYNKDVVGACEETSRCCIQWDVDSLDWMDYSAGEIANRVLSRTKSGSIILLHNGTKNTREALEKILPGLAEKGFKFATVSDLIYKENYIIDHAGTQHPK